MTNGLPASACCFATRGLSTYSYPSTARQFGVAVRLEPAERQVEAATNLIGRYPGTKGFATFGSSTTGNSTFIQVGCEANLR
jgi:hypothetical protein